MIEDEAAAGRFCWVDLAATDAGGARRFYEELFGWTSHEQAANGGLFTRLKLGDRDVGSVYQLHHVQVDNGVPSHWTPYVRVDDVEAVARRAVRCGGEMMIKPFVISGMARIALVLDAVGAPVGLWEPIGGEKNDGNRAGGIDG